jgi:hypothetical protein
MTTTQGVDGGGTPRVPQPMRQSTARSLGSPFDRPLHTRLDPQSIAHDYVSMQSVASRSYWRSSLRADRHSATEYRLRTATNLAAIWTNVADELVTFQTTRDAAGKLLNGSNTYVMQFAPNERPASDWKPFQLTMWVYVPHDVVKRGDWFPPAPAAVM